MTEAAPPTDLNRIAVYLRVRPTTEEEAAQIHRRTYGHILTETDKTPDPKKMVVVDQSGKQYVFDRVFRENTTQREIFEECALPAIQNLLDGYCGAVLAYGQTGTGKTHTMQGTKEDKGVIYRCAEHLFKKIKSDTANNYEIDVNFVQIYLDRLQDMFRPDAPEININPDTERVELPGVTTRKVRSTEEFIECYLDGNKHRVTRATNMNPTSSRGHAAFIVHMKCTPKVDHGTEGTKIGKLVLVDLAGYERFAQTGVEGGIAMEEAKKINHSLLALGSVVNALAAAAEKGQDKGRKDHIPFRNAKLTRLLKDCLGGTSKTSIICTIGPLDKYKQESLGTLYFGFRAMAVKVNANVKTVFDPAKYLESLKQNFQTSQDVIFQMARWWAKSSPRDYAAYCAQYGKPTERDLAADHAPEDDDDQFAAPPTPPPAAANQSFPQQTPPASPPSATRNGAVTNAPVSARQNSDAAGTARDAVISQTGAVRREWNQELAFLRQQAEQEEMQLRQRHMEEQEAMKQKGASHDQMRRLLEGQAQEIEFAKMTANEERQGLLAVREREEVAVILRASVASEALTGAANDRVMYICDFLKDTCQTKNDVVTSLISHVMRREQEIQSLEAAQNFAAAHVGSPTVNDRGGQFREKQALEEEVLTLRMLLEEQGKELQDRRQSMTRTRSNQAMRPSGGSPTTHQAPPQPPYSGYAPQVKSFVAAPQNQSYPHQDHPSVVIPSGGATPPNRQPPASPYPPSQQQAHNATPPASVQSQPGMIVPVQFQPRLSASDQPSPVPPNRASVFRSSGGGNFTPR